MSTRDELAETAFKLFLSNGYRASTMSELVKQSGLSKGAFYHYFLSKQDVYDYVLEHYFLSYFSAVDWQQYEAISYKKLKKEITKYFISLIIELKELTDNNIANYFIMFFEAYNNNPKFQASVKAFYQKLEKIIIRSLRQKGMKKTKAHKIAIKLIALYEGMLYYQAVFPDNNVGRYLELS